jgi:hypothetical protein
VCPDQCCDGIKVEGKKLGVQGQVIVTRTKVDIILLELVQEPNHGENILLDLEPEL